MNLYINTLIVIFFTYSGNRNYKTFKPKKHIAEGSRQYDLMKYALDTLGSGNLRQAVTLPEGEDLNEWIAVNSTYFVIFQLLQSLSLVDVLGK